MTKQELFAQTYAQAFKECYAHLPVDKIEHLIKRAVETALKDIRCVDISGKAFELTFKRLGIKPTYKAVEEFLNGKAA